MMHRRTKEIEAMTRIFATPRKALILEVVGQSVVTRLVRGSRAPKATVRTFRNRYTLRKHLSAQVRAAVGQGFVSVNR